MVGHGHSTSMRHRGYRDAGVKRGGKIDRKRMTAENVNELDSASRFFNEVGPDGASTCEEHIGVVRHLQELRGAASRRAGESLFR